MELFNKNGCYMIECVIECAIYIQFFNFFNLIFIMRNNKRTGKSVSKLASQTLRDNSASKTAKSLAASALSQSSSPNQTGKEIESLASNVLNSSKYNSTTKKLAASILSQSNKSR